MNHDVSVDALWDQEATTGGTLVETWPGNQSWIAPYSNVTYPVTIGYYHVTEPPRECSGDVHVFPCPHCDKCKCGQAIIKRKK